MGRISGRCWWKAAGLALAALLSIGMAPALGAAPATVRLVLSSSQVQIGDTVVAEVWIEGAQNLCGAEIHLNFNAARLQVEDSNATTPGVQIQMGNLFSKPFPAEKAADNAAGTIDFASAQLGCDGTNQPGVLAKFAIRGIAEGAASIAFMSVQLAGYEAQKVFVIPAQLEGGSLVVTGQASPTPTPVSTATPTLTPVPIVPPVSTPTPAATPTPTMTVSDNGDGFEVSTPTPAVTPTPTPCPI